MEIGPDTTYTGSTLRFDDGRPPSTSNKFKYEAGKYFLHEWVLTSTVLVGYSALSSTTKDGCNTLNVVFPMPSA